MVKQKEMSSPKDPFIACPFVVLIDSREQLPYQFKGLKGDARQHGRPLVVTTEWAPLKSGDYSIKGMEDLVAVERKTLADLYNSCGQGRERFEREHERLAQLMFAAVVIEADVDTILCEPPGYSGMQAKAVFRTMLTWMVRYGIDWFPCGGRSCTVLEAAEKLNLTFPAMFYTELKEALDSNRERIWVVRNEVRLKNSRRLGEITTFRLLEKFWKEQTNGG